MEHWRDYEQAMDDLSSLPPEERLAKVIEAWKTEAETLSTADVRKLFVYAWPEGRGSVDDHSHDLLTLLRWISPVRDADTYLSGTLTIYRLAADPDGARWALDEASARAEAADGATTLMRTTVAATDVLAHFTGYGSNEVLVNPNALTSVEKI